MIYIRVLGLGWLCAPVGRVMDTPHGQGRFFRFLSAARVWRGLEKNPGFSAVIGMLTGLWCQELVFVNMYVPPKSKILYCVSKFTNILLFCITNLLYFLTNYRGPLKTR